MNILQISHKYPFPPKDGGAIATVKLADGIARVGHDVSLFAMSTPKHGGISVIHEPGSAYHEIYSHYVDTTIRPFRLINNLMFSDVPYNAERFIDQRFRDKLAGILQTRNYDIIQLEGLYLMPYIDTIRQHSRAKIALRSHNVEHEVWKRMASQTKGVFRKNYCKILARRMASFETSFINDYDLLVPISERDLQFFESHGNTKPAKVIPFGINISEGFHDIRNAEKNALFFIGSLDYMPNQEGLIWFIENVWKKLLHSGHPFAFYVAGRNAPEHLKKYLKKQPVAFLGEIDNAYRLMKTKGVMVVPILSGGGIRVRIVEAMALGIPVVSTTIGAEGLDITHGVNIMIGDDPAAFADAVINLMENQTLFADMGKNARTFVEEKMNGEKLAAELLTFYRNNL